ncbi:MAG: hypothetical protein MJ252_21955 [archaeon]|nr:hypothetical protein [archaeon]
MSLRNISYEILNISFNSERNLLLIGTNLGFSIFDSFSLKLIVDRSKIKTNNF